MTRRIVPVVLLLGAGLCLPAAIGSPTTSGDRVASGTGTIRFGANDNGVAMFEFDVQGTPDLDGSLLCAAEDHDAMPDIVIQVTKIRSARFSYRTVSFTADGLLHNDPVTVHVTAWDGVGTGKPDRFSIRTTARAGHEAGEDFAAEGDLKSGDIRVGPAD